MHICLSYVCVRQSVCLNKWHNVITRQIKGINVFEVLPLPLALSTLYPEDPVCGWAYTLFIKTPVSQRNGLIIPRQ